ncbi:MAG: hypothetical protein K6U88_10185 [Dehalococcoidia bacterium]|nr:hypothetical protein [Dehalococcoidia bacterium]
MRERFRPLLVMRAWPAPEHFAAFRRWAREVHARDTAAVPGVKRVEVGLAPQGVVLVVYVFEDADSVPVALQSPEAAYARGTLQQWPGKVHEVRFEMLAAVTPQPAFASVN